MKLESLSPSMCRGLLCSWILFWVVDPRINARIPCPLTAMIVESNHRPIHENRVSRTLFGGESGNRGMAAAGSVSILDAIIIGFVVPACATPLLVSLNGAILNI